MEEYGYEQTRNIQLISFQSLNEFLDDTASKLNVVDNLIAYPNGELDFCFKDVDGFSYQIHMFRFEKSLERMIQADDNVLYITKNKRFFFQVMFQIT